MPIYTGSCDDRAGKYEWRIDDGLFFLGVTPRGFWARTLTLTMHADVARTGRRVGGPPQITWGSGGVEKSTPGEEAAARLADCLQVAGHLAWRLRTELAGREWDPDEHERVLRECLGLHEGGRPDRADPGDPRARTGGPYPVTLAVGLASGGGDRIALLEAPPHLRQALEAESAYLPDLELAGEFPGPGVYRCTLRWAEHTSYHPDTGHETDCWWEARDVEPAEVAPAGLAAAARALLDAYVEENGGDMPTSDGHPAHALRGLLEPGRPPEGDDDEEEDAA